MASFRKCNVTVTEKAVLPCMTKKKKKEKEERQNKKREKQTQELLQKIGNFWKTKPNYQIFYNGTLGDLNGCLYSN